MSAQTYTAALTAYLTLTGSNGVTRTEAPIPGLSLASSPGQSTSLILNSGDNTIVPPQSPLPTASMVIMQLPSGVTFLLKGAGGDTGINITNTSSGYFMMPIGSASGPGGYTGSFIVNAGSQTSVPIWWV